MRKLFFALITLFIVSSFAFSERALSWEGDPTHKDITDYAAKNSVLSKSKGDYLANLGFTDGLKEMFKWTKNKDVMYWLQEGSALEDKGNIFEIVTGKGRFNNHFHNPLTSKDGGAWGEWESAGLNDYVLFLHYTGQSSLLWAQDGTNQLNFPGGDWSWQEAKDRYYLALTSATDTERQENFARTFRGIGHQLHIIQDKAVPAHVRNDAHPFKHNKIGGLLIEPWAIKNHIYIKSLASNPILPTVVLNKTINYNGETLVPITQFIDTDEYNGSNPSTSLSMGLAEYTNANFFSDDTIFTEDYSTDHRHYFPYPRKSGTNLQTYIDNNLLPETSPVSGDVTFHISKVDADNNKIIDHFVTPTYHTNDVSEPDLYLKTFYLSEECHQDYASKLIPRAVGYSAGLLDYFFRGELDVEFVGGGLKITNKSSETMRDGHFELYYDNEDGDRQGIEIYSGAEVTALQPDGDQTLTFDPPENIVSYIIVYTGDLGNEKNAIVGKIIKPESCYVYVNITSYAYANHKCIIWNPETNTYADLEDPVTGNPITFPCPISDISWWMAKTKSVSKGDIYSYIQAGENGFTGSPPLNGHYEEESTNTGCGALTNTNDSTHFLRIEDESLDYELTVHQVLNARINTLLNSYNLEILNDFNGASCIRTTCDLSSVQSSHFHCAPEDCDSRENTRIWNIVTPIGNIWSNDLQEDYAQETFPECKCTEREIIKSWSVTISNYCDRVIIQIYINHAYLRESKNYSYELGAPYTTPCHPVGGSITLQERIEGIKAACNRYDNANIVDPRTQTSNTAFEAAITDMIHAFYAANGIADYDVDVDARIETDIRK